MSVAEVRVWVHIRNLRPWPPGRDQRVHRHSSQEPGPGIRLRRCERSLTRVRSRTCTGVERHWSLDAVARSSAPPSTSGTTGFGWQFFAAASVRTPGPSGWPCERSRSTAGAIGHPGSTGSIRRSRTA